MSKATVVGVLDAEASSMASIIFLACDQHIVNDNCRMMFHDFSGGASSGKGNEQIKELTASIQLYNNLLKNVCSPFLNDDEIQRIIRGEDFWMDSDEIRQRFSRMPKTLLTPSPASDKKKAVANNPSTAKTRTTKKPKTSE